TVAAGHAVATGPASRASIAPPGRATWPGCEGSPSLRRNSSTSGPVPGPRKSSPNRTSTAAGRPTPAGGLGTLVSVVEVTSALPATSGRSHSGTPAVETSGPGATPVPGPPPRPD